MQSLAVQKAARTLDLNMLLFKNLSMQPQYGESRRNPLSMTTLMSKFYHFICKSAVRVHIVVQRNTTSRRFSHELQKEIVLTWKNLLPATKAFQKYCAVSQKNQSEIAWKKNEGHFSVWRAKLNDPFTALFAST